MKRRLSANTSRNRQILAKQQGKFKPDMFQPFDKLQIVTIQQILNGTRMNLPLMEEVAKKAKKAKKDVQPTLLSE